MSNLYLPNSLYARKSIERRKLLLGGASWLGLAALGVKTGCSSAGGPKFSAYPFSLGIASGDPLPDGFVLWTRLAPDPLSGGGLPAESYEVRWRVAADSNMLQVVQSGAAVAAPELAHSVHVEVSGLEPDRWYWYQFTCGSEDSPVGRTRTAPAPGAEIERLRFCFASCQHYEQGYFTAFRHMAAEDLDLVIHLGDYIYEGPRMDDRVRQHNGSEIHSLEDYRNRYALYRTDQDLQAVHAAFPWIVTWDDHEVDNNYAGAISEEEGVDLQAFLERRSHAYQAYYEHMPLRLSSMPKGPDMQLYRRIAFGRLAEFYVLDTRQYRSDQPCGDRSKPACDGVSDPNATLLGPRQEQWLMEGLERSAARWNVLAQQVMMAKVDRSPGPEEIYSMDQWSGYDAPRIRLLQHLQQRRLSNPVVLTGDIHANWVNDLKMDFRDPKAETVATEFVGTSISSGGDGSDKRPDTDGVLRENPFVRFFNGQRGYVRCEVTPEAWRSDYRVMEYVTRPGGAISTRASFLVEDGKPGAKPV